MAKQKRRNEAKPTEIQPWRGTAEGELLANPRDADPAFWKKSGGGTIQCNLCYRGCKIEPGAAGWCKYRVNTVSRMVIPHYGQLGSLRRLRIGPAGGGIYTYDPGALALTIGGTHCTSKCVFCTSAQIVWEPERLNWLPTPDGERPIDGRRWAGSDRSWFHARGMVHPLSLFKNAENCRATHLLFGDNESLLTWEYTFDVARIAKRRGMKTIVFTNGFSNPEAIRRLAPFVDAVDVGIKGSLSPAFYDKWMRSPGATEHVKMSILEWKRAGVHLVVSNLVATPTMQSDNEFTESHPALCGWLVDNLGQLAMFNNGTAHYPTGHPLRRDYLLPQGPQNDEHRSRYKKRFSQVIEMAQVAGLLYTHYPSPEILCHNCKGRLLWFSPHTCEAEKVGAECTKWSYHCACEWHEQYVTDGHCDHCGVSVPIHTLSAAELERANKNTAELIALGERQFEG